MRKFNMPTYLRFAPFLLFQFLQLAAGGQSKSQSICPKEFTCGHLPNTSFPFSNISQPDCGLCGLNCDANPYPTINFGQHQYGVQNMMGELIVLFDPLLDNLLRKRSCHVFDTGFSFPTSASISFRFVLMNFYKCNRSTHEIDRYFAGYKRYNSCENFTLYYTEDDTNNRSVRGGDFPGKCSVIQLSFDRTSKGSDLFERLNSSVFMEWKVSEICAECHYKGGRCLTDANSNFRCSEGAGKNEPAKVFVILTVASVIGVTLLMITLLFLGRYFFNQISKDFRKTQDERNIEVFLKSNGSFYPKRYSYLEIKRMTNSFTNKLGQGGYSFVYKGKLPSGGFVAVKLLKEAKGSGEEFINEVASIGRTSHINIVNLLGFCFEGDKRALLYEFMPNGSLEKFIYDGRVTIDRQLGWSTLYKIAIGIARGLEYLHRGCRTRILHFDIKPHNILLDEEFCPKISDFGLAKLNTTKDSFMSITGARGTIGYVAPEVACRNFGAVSHKADVYSYGMMVLEMVSGRKNVEKNADRNSEIYFPHWIYRRIIELDNELGLKGITNEEDKEYARKMIMVGLWCIHVDPSIRPSISKVLEMLESSVDSLPLPPKPYLYPSASTEANSSTIHSS